MRILKIMFVVFAFLNFVSFSSANNSLNTSQIDLSYWYNKISTSLNIWSWTFLTDKLKKTNKITFSCNKTTCWIIVDLDYLPKKAFLVSNKTIFKITIVEKSFYNKMIDNFTKIKNKLNDSDFVLKNFYWLYFYVKDLDEWKILYWKDMLSKIKIASLPWWRFLNERSDLHDWIDLTINAWKSDDIDVKIKDRYHIFIKITNELLENNDCYLSKSHWRNWVVWYWNFLFCNNKQEDFSFIVWHLTNFDDKLYNLKKTKSVSFINKDTSDNSKYRELSSKVSASYYKRYMKEWEYYNSNFLLDRGLIQKKLNHEFYQIISVSDEWLELEYWKSWFSFGEHIHFEVLLNDGIFSKVLYDKSIYLWILDKLFRQNMSGMFIEIDKEDELLQTTNCDLFDDNSVCKYIWDWWSLNNSWYVPDDLVGIYWEDINTSWNLYLRKQAFWNLLKLSKRFRKVFWKKIFVIDWYNQDLDNILWLSIDIFGQKTSKKDFFAKYHLKRIEDNAWKLWFIVKNKWNNILNLRYVGIDLSYFLHTRWMSFFDYLARYEELSNY